MIQARFIPGKRTFRFHSGEMDGVTPMSQLQIEFTNLGSVSFADVQASLGVARFQTSEWALVSEPLRMACIQTSEWALSAESSEFQDSS